MKRTYFFPILLVSMAFPVAALAETPGGEGDGGVALSDAAVAALAPLRQPAIQLQRSIDLAVARIEANHRAEVAQRVREQRERFAHLPGGVSMATLESIAVCESGGDPEVVSADGTYRGLYQFNQGTWESVGGHGDPAAASAAEQSYRAALLYARSGSSPWPVCG
jgi:hypothetical protein